MEEVIEKLMKKGLSLKEALEQIEKENRQQEKNLKMYKIMCRYR